MPTLTARERTACMRGQTMNAAQQATVARLRAKGWRGGDVFALAVPMYYDRPFVGVPRPHVVHVRRDGSIHQGYPRAGGPPE
jgi:hypothetical protein